MMKLRINGEDREIPRVTVVRELLEALGIAQHRIAVEINRRIVRRADWDRAPVQDGDKVEIVHFVGGG